MIASEAGATFRRIDGRSFTSSDSASAAPAGSSYEFGTAFDIYARSCICASSSALANELLTVADPVLVRLGLELIPTLFKYHYRHAYSFRPALKSKNLTSTTYRAPTPEPLGRKVNLKFIVLTPNPR